MEAHFLTTLVEIKDRHTEPRYETLKWGILFPAKHEEVVVRINLVSSGNTTKITNLDLVERIMKKLEKL